MSDIYHTPDWGLSLPTLHFDGATPVDVNIGGYGWVLEVDEEEVALDYGKFKTSKGTLSSHYAEFVAVTKGMEAALEMGYQKIKIKGDNKQVIAALNRNRAFDSPDVQRAADEAHRLFNSFPSLREAEWVRRELNQRADELADLGLHRSQKQTVGSVTGEITVEVDPVNINPHSPTITGQRT